MYEAVICQPTSTLGWHRKVGTHTPPPKYAWLAFWLQPPSKILVRKQQQMLLSKIWQNCCTCKTGESAFWFSVNHFTIHHRRPSKTLEPSIWTTSVLCSFFFLWGCTQADFASSAVLLNDFPFNCQTRLLKRFNTSFFFLSQPVPREWQRFNTCRLSRCTTGVLRVCSVLPPCRWQVAGKAHTHVRWRQDSH